MPETLEDLKPDRLSDPARLAAVKATLDLCRAPREDLDALTRLTAYAFKAPICVVTLVDDAHVTFVGKFGARGREHELADCLCSQVVSDGGALEILNLSTHPSMHRVEVAHGPPFVRAYCGQPLRSPDGHVIGTLAIVDTTPIFRFTDEDREALKAATETARRLLFGDRLPAAQSEAAE